MRPESVRRELHAVLARWTYRTLMAEALPVLPLYYRATPYIKLFISLATPWGGDRMAEYGVKQSPAVIPSWISTGRQAPVSEMGLKIISA